MNEMYNKCLEEYVVGTKCYLNLVDLRLLPVLETATVSLNIKTILKQSICMYVHTLTNIKKA